MRSRRVVDISDNGVKWLLPFAVSRPKIRPKNFRKDFAAIQRLAGFGAAANPWVPDCMRHTAISMHFKKHGHEGQTAAWAGNSPDVVHKHYKGLINNGDAEEFWNITPDDQQILRLGKVA